MAYWLRRPRTTQEKRRYEKGFSRPARNLRNLPDAWDDIPRSNCEERCWKHYRKTQYKVVADKIKKDSSRYGLHMSWRDHFHLEHRMCFLSFHRCKYCIKNNIWDDKKTRRAWEKRQEERRWKHENFMQKVEELRQAS